MNVDLRTRPSRVPANASRLAIADCGIHHSPKHGMREEPAIKSHALDTIDWIGWDRLLFATDYPHWVYDDPSQVLPSGIDEARRRAFFPNNACAVDRL
jgi:predicted TIM-barrel fold metal-dependent hydrolase